MQARAPELESNGITFDRIALPKEGPDSSSASDDEDADGVDDPLARLAVDPDLSTQARRRSSTGHLNFVDQVSAGIGSYLARLEAKHTENTTVYNRYSGSACNHAEQASILALAAGSNSGSSARNLSLLGLQDKKLHGMCLRTAKLGKTSGL